MLADAWLMVLPPKRPAVLTLNVYVLPGVSVLMVQLVVYVVQLPPLFDAVTVYCLGPQLTNADEAPDAVVTTEGVTSVVTVDCIVVICPCSVVIDDWSVDIWPCSVVIDD